MDSGVARFSWCRMKGMTHGPLFASVWSCEANSLQLLRSLWAHGALGPGAFHPRCIYDCYATVQGDDLGNAALSLLIHRFYGNGSMFACFLRLAPNVDHL